MTQSKAEYFSDVVLLKRKPLKTDMFTQAEAIAKFGNPKDAKAIEAQMVLEDAPFPMRLYSRTAPLDVKRIRGHKLIMPYLLGALYHLGETYNEKERAKLGIDVFGGGFNIRFMRGAEKDKVWSKHAFGIAFDFLPSENGLKTGAPHATFSRPEYKPYLDIWQACGFLNLGRTANYDYMHFEFMNLERNQDGANT